MAQALPDLLGDVRSHRRRHEDEGLDGLARDLPEPGEVVVEDDELGDGRVQAHPLVVLTHAHDRLGHEPAGLLVGALLGHRQLAGGLVDDVAPQALQEALAAGDGAGVPRAVGIQRPHAHLVDAEGVGAVGLVHVVGGDDVLQGLAHLAVLAAHRLPLPQVTGGAVLGGDLLDLVGGHVLAASIGVGVGLDVTLVEEAVVGLGGGDVAQVEQDLVPEARVKQVQDGMLDAADVQVGAAGDVAGLGARPHPVGLVGRVDERLVVGRVDVAHLVPARAGPLRHRVGLAVVGPEAIAQVELDLDPLGGLAQRRLRGGVDVVGVVGARRVVGDLGQLDGQHRLGQGVDAAVLVPHDREGLTPVALAGEEPVAQAVGDRAAADALGLQPADHGGLGLVLAHAVDVQVALGGVHDDAVTGVGLGAQVDAVGVVGRADGLDDVDVVLGGEGVVALVVGGHGHDGAGPVAHEDVVGHEDRHLRPVDGVDAEEAGEDAGLDPALVGAVSVRRRRGLGAVGGHGLGGGRVAAGPGLLGALGPGGRDGQGRGVVGDLGLGAHRAGGLEAAQHGVLGGHHHEGGAEEGVGAGGVDAQRRVLLVALDGPGHGEGHLGALGAADPVALHELDLLGPVHGVQVLGEAVAVGGDAHHPLAQVALEDRVVAPLGAALGGDLLVGQHRAQAGAPVDGGAGDVGQAEGVDDLGLLGGAQSVPVAAVGDGDLAGGELVAQLGHRPGRALAAAVAARGLGVEPGAEDLQEDPLGPAHVVDVDGGQGAAWVVGQAQAAQLAAHVGDVGLGGDARVLASGDGVLLGGQTEGVVAHRVQDVPASHPGETGDDVGGDVAQRVAHVQALAGGVGEHVQQEELLLVRPGAGQSADGVVGVEGALGLPAVLPGGLDGVRQLRRVAEGGVGLDRCGSL